MSSGGGRQALPPGLGVATGVGQEIWTELGQLGVEVLGWLGGERDALAQQGAALLDDVGDLLDPRGSHLERPGELVAAHLPAVGPSVGGEQRQRLGADRVESHLAVGGPGAPQEGLHPTDPGAELLGGLGRSRLRAGERSPPHDGVRDDRPPSRSGDGDHVVLSPVLDAVAQRPGADDEAGGEDHEAQEQLWEAPGRAIRRHAHSQPWPPKPLMSASTPRNIDAWPAVPSTTTVWPQTPPHQRASLVNVSAPLTVICGPPARPWYSARLPPGRTGPTPANSTSSAHPPSTPRIVARCRSGSTVISVRRTVPSK